MKLACLSLIALLALACGGDSPSPIGPTPTPQPTTTTLSGSVDAFGLTRHVVTGIARAGRLTAVLTWSDPLVDLDLFLAPTSCANLYPKPDCGILVESGAPVGVVREQVTFDVSAGQTYHLFIDNQHRSVGQSYTVQVTYP